MQGFLPATRFTMQMHGVRQGMKNPFGICFVTSHSQPHSPYRRLQRAEGEKRSPPGLCNVLLGVRDRIFNTIILKAKANKKYENKKELINYGKRKKRTTSAVGTGAITNRCERKCLSVCFSAASLLKLKQRDDAVDLATGRNICVSSHGYMHPIFIKYPACIWLHDENISDHGPKLVCFHILGGQVKVFYVFLLL